MQQGHPRWIQIDKALREDAIREVIKGLGYYIPFPDYSLESIVTKNYASKNM